ncbi:DUF998 domain-containing protein [Nonomuraea sp. NPDC050790]|uniref:DUF998 domain-containing protein n=1 Tax=Nonomuraea sp. NPDC050790 TaxID=3364371 RepID=UPI0037929E78
MAAVKKFYPHVAFLAIAFSVVAVVVGQIVPDPYLDPMNVTVSEYAVADRGGVTELGMAVLGLGSFVLLAGLRAAGAPIRGLPQWLLGVWSGALLVAAAVPTTPIGMDMTTTALIHRYVSIAAFVSLPAAAALLVPRFAADARWKPIARTMEWLALAGGLGVLAIAYVAMPGDRVLIGLVERVLLGAEVAVLGVLAAWLVRLAWGKRVQILTYHKFLTN